MKSAESLRPAGKNERQQAILELVRRSPVRTQEELVSALHRRGLDVTQATVSRDIRELGLVRAHGADGARYVVAEAAAAEPPPSGRLRSVMRDHVRSMEMVENLGVIHTRPSSAPLVGSVIDAAHFEEVAGTVAGDDTVLVVVRSRTGAAKFAARVRALMEGGR